MMHVYKKIDDRRCSIIPDRSENRKKFYAKLARAVANAWIGEKGAWKSRMKLPLSILPNCKTYKGKI